MTEHISLQSVQAKLAEIERLVHKLPHKNKNKKHKWCVGCTIGQLAQGISIDIEDLVELTAETATRLEAGRTYLAEWEAENGPITEEEMAAADAAFDAANPRGVGRRYQRIAEEYLKRNSAPEWPFEPDDLNDPEDVERRLHKRLDEAAERLTEKEIADRLDKNPDLISKLRSGDTTALTDLFELMGAKVTSVTVKLIRDEATRRVKQFLEG